MLKRFPAPPKMHLSVIGLAEDQVYTRSLTDDSGTVDFSVHLGLLSFSSYARRRVQLSTLFVTLKTWSPPFTPESC